MTTTTKSAKSAKSYNEAAEMLKGYTFEYSTENYSNDYKVTYRYFNGTNEHGAKCFAMIETIEDGKLVNVRFINTYRQTAVDIKIEIDDATDTDADEYAVSEAAMEVAIATEEANAASNMTDIEKVIAERKTMTVRELFLEAKKEVGYNLNARGAKMWFISYPRYDINTEEYVGHTVPLKRTSKDVEIYLREEYCGMTLKTFLAEEKTWIDEETDKVIRQLNIDYEAEHTSDKVARDAHSCDDNDDVFNLLPTLDELNDVDNEPEPPTVDDFDNKRQERIARNQLLSRWNEELSAPDFKAGISKMGGKNQNRGVSGTYLLSYGFRVTTTKDEHRFMFSVNTLSVASYDTPAQVDKVIDLLKAAIARGDKEFIFPTIEELKPPKKFSGTLYKTNFNGRRHVFVGRARHNKGVMPMIVG